MPPHIFGETLELTHEGQLSKLVNKNYEVAHDFVEGQRKMLRNSETQSLSMQQIFENLTDDLERMSNERAVALALKDNAQIELAKISSQMGSLVSEIERLQYMVEKQKD